MSKQWTPPNTPPGPATDSSGQTVLDPTSNVFGLVYASERRQDDLRKAAENRQDDLREKDAAHFREILYLQSKHADQLADKETDRLDAIRAVDTAAVTDAAAVQVTQANALAAQVTVSADAARANVAAAATAQAIALKAETDPLRADIADLRKSQYQGVGGHMQVLEGRGASAHSLTLAVGLFGFLNVAISIFALLRH